MTTLFTVIVHLYNFHVAQSLLVFNILEKLTGNFTEKDMELILLMLRNVGFSLRKDDVLSLEMIKQTQGKAIGAGGKFQGKTRIRFMLEKMLVLKDNDMQRTLGFDPEPVEKLRKLQRALSVDVELVVWSRLSTESVCEESVCEESVDVESVNLESVNFESVDVESVSAESDRGHIPQWFLEELLGDSMALEAEQVQRMNQHTHLSWEMEQLSEASSHILENQTLQGTVQEMRGALVALQESSLRCTELQEENQQLRKQGSNSYGSGARVLMEQSLRQHHMSVQQKGTLGDGTQRKEKNSSQEWETLTEELVKALEQLLNEVDTLKADRALQILELERQLQIEKDNSQNLENISKELLKDLKQVLDAVDTLQAKAPQQLDPSLLASKNQQAAKEREWEELYELLEQLIQVHEALRQDHTCLGALHDQLSGQYQALVEEHSHHKTLLRPSLEMASKAFRRRWMEELRLQLLQEKDTNQEWETFTEELVKELEQLRHEVDTLKADRALQILELERQLQIEKDNSQNLENINKELLKDLKQVLDAVDTVKAEAPQMLELERQLQIEKDNSQNLENINKELLKDLKQVLDAVDTLQAKAPQLDPSLLASKNQQAAKEREWEELYELLEQLIQVHEALRQDHACLGALHDQLSGQYQALVEEHSRHKTLLRPSLEMASKAFRRREQDQRQHEQSLQELGKLLNTQREALKQEQEANALAAQEEERLRQELDREEGKQEGEGTVLDAYESKDPAPRKKKRWIGARAFIKLFNHKSSGSREPAEPSPDRPPGPLEATPSCSYRMEERDAPSVPVGKAARPKKDKRKKTDKSPAARPAWWKRLQCWSSSDIPPPSK
uniref:Uncharacterized protein n=1 Tax=Myotis myotis TaxID=51298 RepID=A0A7J8ANF0_MYOMY|nr:hypothetical protein mMyoMyo1_008197 [Myotis myotis]